MKTIKYILTFLLILTALIGKPQDPQFSQFYAVPLYLSPSFAGSTDGSRVAMNYRIQWPEIPGAFQTFSASFDHYFPSAKSGVGFLFTSDRAGKGRLSSTNAGFQYSYNFNLTRKLEIKPGIHFYTSQRKVDYSRLMFGDQLYWNSSTSMDNYYTQPKTTYIDFAASCMAYTKRYWTGLKIDHLLTPNQSLINGESQSIIPRAYTIFGGYKFATNGRFGRYDEESLTLAFLYKSQGKFDQLDLGGYWSQQPLVIGLWYRGIPILKKYKDGYANNDALVILAGYKIDDLSIGYSYDFTISRLMNSTGGAHELSIIFLFNQDQKVKKKRRHVIVDCPKF